MSNHSVFARIGDFPGLQRLHRGRRFVDLRPHFLEELRHGDWRTVISLSLGALVCGLFWEMWNYYSFPKWVYHVPRLGFWHIFEMPLLGYGGYVPFALELYALKNFLWPNGPGLRN